MKIYFRTAVANFLIILFFLSCAESDDTIYEQENDTNFLINSSFEINGNPSLLGWYSPDTSMIDFAQDTPPDGGNWSVTLEANWGPPFFISSTVAAKQGTHHYNLSLWSKVQGVGGAAYLNLKQTDTLIVRKSVTISDTTWTTYSLLDTITAIESDSIVVTLTGGFSHLFYGKTYFDLCMLEKIE